MRDLTYGIEPSRDPTLMLPRGAIYVHGKIKPEMGTPEKKMNERALEGTKTTLVLCNSADDQHIRDRS